MTKGKYQTPEMEIIVYDRYVLTENIAGWSVERQDTEPYDEIDPMS